MVSYCTLKDSTFFLLHSVQEEELQKRKSDLEDQVHQAKRRTLGNIRFIGELFKLKVNICKTVPQQPASLNLLTALMITNFQMLTESIMHDCIVKLLRRNDEESFECLCKLLVTIGKDLDHEKGKVTLLRTLFLLNKLISVLLSQCSTFEAVTRKSYPL